MKKEEILLMTDKFIIYYDNEMKRYDFPNDVVEKNNKFKFDILCVQLNKVIKNLNKKKFYLFYVDPNFNTFKPRTYDEYESIVNISNSDELEEILYQKVDTEEYSGRVYAFNNVVNVLLRNRYNSDVLSRAVDELKPKIYLCDLFEPLTNYAKKHDYTGCFMFFFEDLYFYYIFKSGNYVCFNYKNRKEKSDNEIQNDNSKSGVIMSDLGTLISSVGHIREDLKSNEKADFILFSKLTKNETFEEYLKTLYFNSYQSISDINSFLLDELRDKPIVNFKTEEIDKRSFKLKPYILFLVLSIFVFVFSIYKYLDAKKEFVNIKAISEEVSEKDNELSESTEIKKKEDEQDKKIENELQNIKSSYSFSNIDLIDKVYYELQDKGDIKSIEIKGDNLVVSIISNEEFNLNKYDVVKKYIKENKFHYTLRYKYDWF